MRLHRAWSNVFLGLNTLFGIGLCHWMYKQRLRWYVDTFCTESRTNWIETKNCNLPLLCGMNIDGPMTRTSRDVTGRGATDAIATWHARKWIHGELIENVPFRFHFAKTLLNPLQNIFMLWYYVHLFTTKKAGGS